VTDPGGRPPQRLQGNCHFYGVNVHCLAGFDPSGIPVRATVGAAMS